MPSCSRNEPRGKKRLRVEALERPEQEMALEQAEQTRGGFPDGSGRFISEGTTATSSKITDGTSNT